MPGNSSNVLNDDYCLWGDDLLDTTQGLDILGVRGVDQAVELALVNGITTISQRARYLSILPWALGEFLVEHATKGFDWDSLMIYLRKIEFVILAASRLDNELNGADASGALGTNLHQELLASFGQWRVRGITRRQGRGDPRGISRSVPRDRLVARWR